MEPGLSEPFTGRTHIVFPGDMANPVFCMNNNARN